MGYGASSSSPFSSAGCLLGNAAPAEIDGLATGGAESKAVDVERYGCLTVAEVMH
jgi:hypothetical protein